MKCIKTAKGKVTRVEDGVAHEMVRSGEAKFVAKSEWKKVRGPVKEKAPKKETSK